jgi:hypothetical protein
MTKVHCDIVDNSPEQDEEMSSVQRAVGEALSVSRGQEEWDITVGWHQVTRYSQSWNEAVREIASRERGVALVDYYMPGDGDGIRFIEELREHGYAGYTYVCSGLEDCELERIFTGNPSLLRQHGAGVIPREPGFPRLTRTLEVHLRRASELSLDPFLVADPGLFLRNPTEAALCALSAALPFGLLAEVMSGSFATAKQKVQEETSQQPDDFEGLIRAYLCATEQRDELLAKVKAHPLGQALAEGKVKTSIGQALEDLAEAMRNESLPKWNESLTKLRDEWLSDAREGAPA